MRPATWYEAIEYCHGLGQAYVLVTVISTAGSTPRNTGSKMVVTDNSCIDTFGGGHLEYVAIEKAKSLLLENNTTQHIEHYPLSSKLGQCCGGAINILYELVNSHIETLAVFGAGHVAKALMPIVEQLPLQVQWIDNRENMFLDCQQSRIKHVETDDPSAYVANLPQNTMVLVMTHNHQLDFDIVEKAITRTDISYVGMIGSATKAKRFKNKLALKQFPTETINKLISPVGNLTVPGKLPIEVAISIAAQIVQHIHSKTPESNGLDIKQQWLNTKQIMSTL